MSSPPVSRAAYLALALVTISLGLVVHRAGAALGPVARDVAGDALWAAMVLWWIGVIAPRAPWRARATVALGVCFAVEWSQRYHTPALDALRRTELGRLVLGSGFDQRDLASYIVGVLAAVLVERTIVARIGAARRRARSRASG